MNYKAVSLESILKKLHHSSHIHDSYDVSHLVNNELFRLARSHKGVRVSLRLSAKEELETRGFKRSFKGIWHQIFN